MSLEGTQFYWLKSPDDLEQAILEAGRLCRPRFDVQRDDDTGREIAAGMTRLGPEFRRQLLQSAAEDSSEFDADDFGEPR